jgi:hypothetical protein
MNRADAKSLKYGDRFAVDTGSVDTYYDVVAVLEYGVLAIEASVATSPNMKHRKCPMTVFIDSHNIESVVPCE